MGRRGLEPGRESDYIGSMSEAKTPRKVSKKAGKKPGGLTTTIGGVTIKLAYRPKRTAKARAIQKAVREFYAKQRA